jgi:hypothetical protein
MFLDEMAAGEPQRRWPEWLIHIPTVYHEFDFSRPYSYVVLPPKIRCSPVSNCKSSAPQDCRAHKPRLKRKLDAHNLPALVRKAVQLLAITQ